MKKLATIHKSGVCIETLASRINALIENQNEMLEVIDNLKNVKVNANSEPEDVPPIRKTFLEELQEYKKSGRTCFCGEGHFCDC